jgi:PHD/YefM family antitoxin component YafN of YafNO toxin-antitoxin module
MNTINANELKTRGVTAIESALLHDSDVAISVRGKTRFVVVNVDYFQQLRECELEKAVREAREDIAAGRFVVETAAQHKERIMAKYGLQHSDTRTL